MSRQNVNSLFISWLTEWRKEAADKNLKVQYIYAKALKSIQKFPLSLTSGIECKLLEGFGDKLCGQIEERLNKELQESGNILSPEEYIKSFDEAKPVKNVFTKIKQKNNEKPHGENVRSSGISNSKSYTPAKNSGAYALILTLANHFKKFQSTGETSMGKQELMDTAQPLSDSSFKIPLPGSHYTAWSSMGTLIKKGLVIKDGNPSKYRITSEGTEVARKLEAVENSSDAIDVRDLVLDLNERNYDFMNNDNNINNNNNNNKEGDDDDDVIILPEPVEMPTVPVTSKKASLSSFPSLNSLLPSSPTLSAANSPVLNPNAAESKPSWFMFVKEDGNVTSLKDKAVVSVDENTFEIRFLVKCKYHDLLMSGKNYTIDYSRSCSDDDVFAFIRDADAPDVLINNPPVSSTPIAYNSKKHSIDQSYPDNVSPILSSNTSTTSKPLPSESFPLKAPSLIKKRSSMEADLVAEVKKKKPNMAKAVSVNISETTNNSQNSKPLPSESFPLKAPSLIKKRSSMEADLTAEVKKKKPKMAKAASENISEALRTTNNSQNSTLLEYIKTMSAPKSSKITIDPKIDDTTKASESLTIESSQSDVLLLPEDFEIVLLVDNRESLGPAVKSPSEEMLYNELAKNKILFEVRQLQLGDFVWIARSKHHIGRPVELVLNYIVERKRMDDLSSSIVDGRFREQKFRLTNCGLSNIIYLVEELGKSAHLSIPEASLDQAIINTQVVDEFIVKRVKSAKDLTNYLVLMTRFLQGQYQKLTLYGFNKFFKQENLKEKCGLQVCLMGFDVFTEQSTKSKTLSVSEMFLIQLTQINGLSSEKAYAITQKYPTPVTLYEAYKNCLNEGERHKMLADIKCGSLRRNLGPALSKTIANIYS